jgi:hypothetical protein
MIHMKRDFRCRATGEPCADGRCTNSVCCIAESERVEEAKLKVKIEQRAYWQDHLEKQRASWPRIVPGSKKSRYCD